LRQGCTVAPLTLFNIYFNAMVARWRDHSVGVIIMAVVTEPKVGAITPGLLNRQSRDTTMQIVLLKATRRAKHLRTPHQTAWAR